MSAQSTHVIIGAGQAGLRAAESMRAAGFDGRIVLIGEEACRPYERPPLSKQLLMEDGFDDKVFLQPDGFFDEQRIELLLACPATAVDVRCKTVMLKNGKGIRYDKLLITTGSRPRRLSRELGADGVHYLRTLYDSFELRAALTSGRKIVLIGGGVIGLEIAAAAVHKGCAVTILEAAERLMGRAVSPEISAYYHDLHASRGVIIHYGVSIAHLDHASHAAIVTLDDGRSFEGDVVLAGIGVIPNVEIAEAAGIAVDDGVLVDAYGRTSVAEVFAAGEVTSHVNARLKRRQRLENWLHADHHGRLVGRNMCGDGEPYTDIPWFWTDQYDANLQIAGSPFAERHVLRGDPWSRKFSYFHIDGARVVGASAVNNPRDIRFAKKMIESGAPIDLRALGDPSCDLKDVAEKSSHRH